jgi:hypothetical protein
MRKTVQISVKIAFVPAEIRTQYFPITSLEFCRYIAPLSHRWIESIMRTEAVFFLPKLQKTTAIWCHKIHQEVLQQVSNYEFINNECYSTVPMLLSDLDAIEFS